MSDRWIVIPRWEEFQHYADRDPIWIKNHRSLLHSDEYRSLTLHQRGVLHGLWLEYAASNRQIRDSTLTLTRQLGQRVSRATLDRLSEAGFVDFSASKPLAPRYHSRASREESREEIPLTPQSGAVDNDDEELLECQRCGKPVRPRARCRFCGATPRQAGTNPRQLAKPSAYERALAFTQNVGVLYEPDVFVDELSRFELSDEQRRDLVELRAGLNGASTNPFIGDD